jgi:OmpA-OmpF porin, OOP family
VRPHIFRFGAAVALAALSLSANDEAPVRTDSGNDFVQGKRVILATDFAREPLGGFPRTFELKSGNMEVATVGGKRFFRATSSGEFFILLPEVLPQRFTLEFDLAGSGGWYQNIYFSGDEEPYYVSLRPQEDGGIQGPNDFDTRSEHGHTVEEGKPVNVWIMADGQYVKVFMNGTRVANAPNAKIGRSKKIRFRVAADTETPMLLGNLRIAAGGKDLYRALTEEGSFTAEGILFDTNSDRIRPESANVLKEIAVVLGAHADLKVSIEGHTDNSGSDDINQALSEKRAAAVKAWLTTQGKVPGDRLESAGFGSSRPAASNETAEGKQTNRRVELVRL